jgi:hypothetical protein
VRIHGRAGYGSGRRAEKYASRQVARADDGARPRPDTRPVRNRVRSSVLLCTLLLAAACGGAAADDDVKAAWEKASHAAAGGDATEFCSMVTAAGKRTITARTQLSCEDGVRLLSSRLSAGDKTAIRGAAITKVEVDGASATVSYEVNPALAKVGFTGTTRMQKVKDRWLLRGI